MAFSNTVATTRVNVGKLMADAAMLCGKQPSDLTAERVDVAKRFLFYFLAALKNVGINLWCIEQTVLGTVENKEVYDLPLGTQELLDLQYRQFTRPTGDYYSSAGGTAYNAFDSDVQTSCTQTAPDGYISIDFGSSIPITVLGFMANGSHTYNLVYEYSLDNITWTTIYAPGSLDYTDYEWISAQIQNPVSAQYFRVRETGGATLNVREALFGYNIYDIACTRCSRDAYAALPNKDQANNMPPQFYFNRILTRPQFFIWPAINSFYQQFVVYRDRQIMDVGDLTNELEVPDRWLDSVVANLAERMSSSIFRKDTTPQDRQELQARAQYFLSLASAEERDISAVQLAFNTSEYTR